MGYAPIMLCLDDVAMMEELLTREANPNQKIDCSIDNYVDNGVPVIHLACKQKQLKALELLLKHGADPNAVQDKRFSNLCTALHISTGNCRSLACVKELLKYRRTNVQALDKYRSNVLHYACSSKLKESEKEDLKYIIKLLIDVGTPLINYENARGETPLYSFYRHNVKEITPAFKEIFKYMLQHGAIIPSAILHEATACKDLEMINFLLEDIKINPNLKNEKGHTPLHVLYAQWAQMPLLYPDRQDVIKKQEEEYERIRCLLSKRVNRSLKNYGGKTGSEMYRDFRSDLEKGDHVIPKKPAAESQRQLRSFGIEKKKDA